MSDMTTQNAIYCMKAMLCEEVCEECDYYGKTGTDHCEADAVRMAIKALEEQPHWIPCSEGLPEENDDYWVTADPRYVPPNYKSTDIVSWYEGKWLMADYFVLDGEKRKMPTYKVMEVNIPIIAWMPLPKPYGGENDE